MIADVIFSTLVPIYPSSIPLANSTGTSSMTSRIISFYPIAIFSLRDTNTIPTCVMILFPFLILPLMIKKLNMTKLPLDRYDQSNVGLNMQLVPLSHTFLSFCTSLVLLLSLTPRYLRPPLQLHSPLLPSTRQSLSFHHMLHDHVVSFQKERH